MDGHAVKAPEDYQDPEELYQALIARVRKYHPSADITMIEKAYQIGKEAHKNQFRKSGEPYIIHPVAVAEIVVEMGLDTDSICAALLHDCIEQPYYVSWLHDDLTAATKAGEMDLAVYVVGKTEQ